MEIKVGDYARSSEGDLGKIVRINNSHDIELEYSWVSYDEEDLKSSPNIIDLIEVGDYVNGFEVLRIDEECKLYPKTLKCQYPNNTYYFDIFNENIKSIVTKEQFSQMEYKIND